MDLQTQLENHEQRCRLASTGTLKVTMPGEQVIDFGEYTVGHLPVGALISGYQAWINPDELFGADVTISLGIPSDKTMFFNAAILVDGSSTANSGSVPVLEYVSNEPLILTIAGTTKNVTGKINVNVDYSEIDTKAGKYTH